MLEQRFETVPIGPGIRAHVLSTDKFKTTTVKAYLASSLGPDATAFAIVPYVLKRGTRALPTQREITRRLEDLYGASCLADITKLGERQIWTLRLEIVADAYLPGVRLFPEGVRFLRDLLLDPRTDGGSSGAPAFVAEFVEQEKRNLRKFIEGLINDKGSYAVERCSQEMCEGEPFGRYEYGRVADLGALDPSSLLGFWKDRVDRCPVDVYVLGDVAPEPTFDALRDAFSTLRPGDFQPALASPNPKVARVREVVEEMPVQQAKLVLGYRSAIHYRDPRFPWLQLMNGVLGTFPHSKLFRHVREEQSLCYSIYSSIERTKGLAFVSAGIDSDKYREVLGRIDEQLEKVRKGEVSADEMEMAKLSLENGYRQVLDSAARTIAYHYGAASNGRTESLAEAARAMRAVTLDQVTEAARQLELDTVYLLRDGGGKGGP